MYKEITPETHLFSTIISTHLYSELITNYSHTIYKETVVDIAIPK